MSIVPVLLVSARDDVEAMLAADPGAIATIVTRVPRLEDPSAAAARWKIVVLDAASVRDAVDLGARLREASDQLEFIVVTSDPRELVEAIRAGAYQAVSWPCDPAELWDPIATCVKKIAPTGAPDSVGDFRFKEKLASGGMGDVWLAESPRFERSVVVKLLQSAFASVPEFASMFRSEARLSAQLVHPNIVRVLEHGEVEGRLFLAMEHIHGWDLLDVGRALGWRFPAEIAFHVVAEIASALDYAHSRVDERGSPLRIVHRDVDPPNILLSRDGRVLLSDFGIAKSAQASTQTQAGVIKGKVEYFSPEQIAGEPLDARSDLFPLGAVLYLLLTGVHPFRGPSRTDTLRRVRFASYTPPSEVVSGLPPEADRVIARALTRSRDDRYATAGEMERDLRVLAGGRVPEDELAEFLTRSMDDRTRIAGARAARSHSASGVRSIDTGEPTISREGAAPGEATVVRDADAESTALRPVSLSPSATADRLRPDAGDTTDPRIRSDAVDRTDRRPRPGRAASSADASSTAISTPAGRPADRSVRATDGRLFPALKRKGVLSPPAMIGLAGVAAGILLLAIFAGGPDVPPRATRMATRTPTPLAARTSSPEPAVTVTALPTPAPSATIPATTSATHLAASTAPTPRATTPPLAPIPTASAPRATPTALVAATRKPTPGPVSGRGTLTIWMPSGWAAISVDGKPLGVNAPRVGIELPAGPHRITLENPPAKFRQDYDVVIATDKELRLEASLP